MERQKAWEEDSGSEILDVQQAVAALDKGLEGSQLAGLGTEGHLDQKGMEQRDSLAVNHHMMGIHMEGVVGSSHPEVHTVSHEIRRTLEGSVT